MQVAMVALLVDPTLLKASDKQFLKNELPMHRNATTLSVISERHNLFQDTHNYDVAAERIVPEGTISAACSDIPIATTTNVSESEQHMAGPITHIAPKPSSPPH